MRNILVIVLVFLALGVTTGLVLNRQSPNLAVSVRFLGYTNITGGRFARFGITNECTFPVRRLGCYNAYEQQPPLDRGSTYTFGPHSVLAPGQSELVTVPVPRLNIEGRWKAAFLCQPEGLRTKLRDLVNSSWFALEVQSSGPVDLLQSEWIVR